MTILKRIQKEKEFVEKMSVILNRLQDWQIEGLVTHQKPSREAIVHEWASFVKLLEQAKEGGIAGEYFYYEMCKMLVEAFKFFEDVVPEFKELKELK